MKRLFRMLILFSVLALLPACRSGNFSSSEEGVRKARIVSVSSDALENKARYGKTFWIVAADRNEYNEECKKYKTGDYAVPVSQEAFSCRVLIPARINFKCVKN